jgi:hypothetical protein
VLEPASRVEVAYVADPPADAVPRLEAAGVEVHLV